MFPKRREIADYGECIQNKGTYCTLDAILDIPSNNKFLLDSINIIEEHRDFYDNRNLYRTICVPQSKEINNESISSYLSNAVNQNLKEYNLTATIGYQRCTNGESSITLFDNIFLVGMASFIVFILFATFYDWTKKSKGLMHDLSVITTWKNIMTIQKNEDYQKLMCMNGVRSLGTIIIISVHTIVYYFWYHFSDPNLLQTNKFFIQNWQTSASFSIFGVRIFFMISAWLSTLQVYNILAKCEKLTLRNVGILILHRYFRFTASLLVVAFWYSNWIFKFSGPINFDVLSRHNEACRANWFYNIIYFNNYFSVFDICNITSWSISADFQLYVINMIAMYIIFKYNFNEYKAYTIMFIIYALIEGFSIYWYDMTPIYILSPKLLRSRNIFLDEKNYLEFTMSYTSTYSVTTSSLVGMLFATIYYKTKRKSIELNYLKSFVWFIVCYGLSFSAIILSTSERRGIDAVILGVIIKPVFLIGFAILIMGMVYNIRGFGIHKKVTENRLLVIMSDFSYSSNICNFAFCLLMYINTIPEVMPWTLVLNVCRIYGTSLFVGILITLLIERPLFTLQKKILPSINTRKDEEKKIH